MKNNQCGLRCVKLAGVSVKRGNRYLIEDINLELHCGHITAVIGANGAGKTTLIRAILGDIGYSGSINFTDHNSNEVSGIKIGYVPQKLNFDTSSPICVSDLFCSVKTSSPVFLHRSKNLVKKVKERLKEVGCEALISRRLGELSGGELQRIMLALALDPIPDLLILDEPVSGVDAGGLEKFYFTVSELRKQYHMAIVLVSHDLDLVAKYSDTVALMGGRLLSFGEPELVYSTDEFKKAFGNLSSGGFR